MEYKINGTVMQSLEVRLKQGESMYTESGGMAWMTNGIDMKTGGRGGIGKSLGRMFSGESLFMTSYSCSAQQGMITFTPEALGKIIPLNLQSGYSMICQKDAFMCAQETVDLSIHFRKRLGAGLFGGEGFILQKITGPGLAFVEIVGEVLQVELAPGERLKIDPGHIAMYEPTVDYDIQMIRGVMNWVGGGEGLFLATLTGPGKVWLQTMPIANMAAKLAPILGGTSSSSGGGGALRAIFKILDIFT